MNDRVNPLLVPAYGDLLLNQQEVPLNALAGLDAQATAALLAAAADIALVIDRQGLISSVSVGNPELSVIGHQRWQGKAWVDIVTPESRSKVTALLEDASEHRTRRWRHINFPVAQGSDVPMLYSAVQLGEMGQIVAFGRDMRQLASLQQRLVGAQLSLERDYLRLRHLETRYRLLFDSVAEGVMVVGTASQKVTEANAAARLLCGVQAHETLDGRLMPDLVNPSQALALADYLGGVRSTGRGDGIALTLVGSGVEVLVRATLIRHEGGSSYLIQMCPVQGASLALPVDDEARSRLAQVVEAIPDAFVVTDTSGKVLSANHAFLELTQEASAEQVHNEPLERWLGRTVVDQSVLLSHLRQSGSIRLFSTTLRGRLGLSAQVEISAASVPGTEPPALGFAIRDVGRRISAETTGAPALPRSVEQMAELVGRVPLKEIVGETTDLIEQCCIEAALELTRGNRASAAEMLGLSRQSLYVKLRRFGLVGEQDSEN
ncbi:MAG: transcriptional regulator PpsR [Betaproteobacteria bacterium]|nr:transcriptional regulator PpsR [Betaproteobacteria bacterium]NBT10065.1 transcriptional regulator PpsR [Betaproteobacteria bacterium]NBU50207.1 transcriptional regulator PpsR [Betaproteobacteria bacterium]NBX96370.1 transcriptional regulator PpsR [Betaproteobacteria bacterium]